MRVAFVADDLYPGYGGQAAATEGHIEALLSLGHEVWVLAGETPSPTQPPGVAAGRLPVWRPGEKQTQLALPQREKVQELLDWADVVQVNTPTPLAFRALRLARKCGVPTVLGFHTQEESMTLHFSLLRPLVGSALRGWYRLLYRQPDCVVAPTGFAAELVRRYTPRPVHVVSNAIRLLENGAARQERAASLRLSMLSGKRFLLLYMGRLTHEKDPGSLLTIMAALSRLRGDVRLVVVGDGPLRPWLERRVARLGLKEEITFLGHVSGEKQELLMAGDLFIMPSPTELQSIATLEAMAQGCAVVAAKYPTSAVCGMVGEADCGVCYLPERVDGAAEAISGLLDSPDELHHFQENAVEAAQEHDVVESGKRLEGIYHALIEGYNKGGDDV